MKNNIKIRKFKWSDLKEVSLLVNKTFAKFNSKEGTKKAIQWYLDKFDPKKTDLENIKKMFLGTPIIFVALDNKKIVGMIRENKEKESCFLRVVAKVELIDEPIVDPDGKAVGRIVVNIEEAIEKLGWGEKGEKLIELAKEKYQEVWGE